MLIMRLKAIVAFFLFLIIGLVVFYFSIRELIDYYNFYDVIIYSWMDSFVLLFSFVIFLSSIYPGYVAFYGVSVPAGKSKNVYKILIVFFVASLIVPNVFSFFYLNKIESKGYIKCQGIPSGWMPGMATKYVTNEALCLRNKP